MSVLNFVIYRKLDGAIESVSQVVDSHTPLDKIISSQLMGREETHGCLSIPTSHPCRLSQEGWRVVDDILVEKTLISWQLSPDYGIGEEFTITLDPNPAPAIVQVLSSLNLESTIDITPDDAVLEMMVDEPTTLTFILESATHYAPALNLMVE